jgi:hypothetical protein
MAISIKSMKARNKAAGFHWFDKAAMRFFNTAIETVPNKDYIFITSDYMDDPAEKRYTLRWFDPQTSKVETLGDFQAYETIEQARQARRGVIV